MVVAVNVADILDVFEQALHVGARSGHSREVDLRFAPETLTRDLFQANPVKKICIENF